MLTSLTTRNRSLKNILDNSGPKMERWGTPKSIYLQGLWESDLMQED